MALSPAAAERAIHIRNIESEPIRDLNQQYTESDLDVQPEFQRRAVWDNKRKSKFIESVLLGFPIPLIFLAEVHDNSVKRYVIDGQQRLRALFEFISGGFALQGLGEDSPYETMTFQQTPAQGKFLLTRHLRTVTITAQSDQDVAFDLFQRLNRGATSLNEQELRNCKYNKSRFNKFLIDVAAKEKKFSTLMGFKAEGTAYKRMLDVEAVLRFMAFLDQGYLNHPNKRTAKFLNNEMDRSATMPGGEQEKRRKLLRNATDLCRIVFGEHAFRRFHSGNADNPAGRWEKRVNKSLADVQLYWFTQYPKGEVVGRADLIRENAIELMLEPVFDDLLTHSASDSDRVRERFEKWKDMLGKVLTGKAVKAAFSYAQKQKAFKQDATCGDCGQAILLIDDAEMDHVVPRSRGGLTTEENAALLHRFCNRQKGARASKNTHQRASKKKARAGRSRGA